MANLSPVTEYFAVQDAKVAQLIADYPPGTAPAAPSTPAAPTGSGPGWTGGAATLSYTVVDTNGTDSAASTLLTTATALAALPTTTNSVNVTTTAVPANTVRKVLRFGTQLIGRMVAGQTVFVDTGQTGVLYVANSDGVGVAYGPYLDLAGIKMVKVTNPFKSVDLRGDFAPMDTQSIGEIPTIAWQQAKMSLDAYAMVTGQVITYAGAAPNRTVAVDRFGTSRPNRFKFEAQSVAADPINGDVHIIGYKCVIDGSVTSGFADDNFQIFDFGCKCVQRNADGAQYREFLEETAVAIPIGA